MSPAGQVYLTSIPTTKLCLLHEVIIGFLCGCCCLFLGWSAANSRGDDPVCSKLFYKEIVYESNFNIRNDDYSRTPRFYFN